MLRAIRAAHSAMTQAVERGVPVDAATTVAAPRALSRMKSWPPDRADALAGDLIADLDREMESL